jgi:hypothetical protein
MNTGRSPLIDIELRLPATIWSKASQVSSGDKVLVDIALSLFIRFHRLQSTVHAGAHG